MKDSSDELRNGYERAISDGLKSVGNLDSKLTFGSGTYEERIAALRRSIDESEYIIIGAGSGLSTSAGFTYSGERFRRYFSDFQSSFGITDMYSGGFYPFPEPEIRWAWWSRHIYYNRYVEPPIPVYRELMSILKDRDYFVVTTNVDHQFQAAGIDKERLFYTQGDYGLFQSVDCSDRRTYDNRDSIFRMMESQGFVKDANGVFGIPDSGVSMRIPSELVPRDGSGREMVMNLRSDDSFVEDDGWRAASSRYYDFLDKTEDAKVLYLELGVGYNTPIIIKFPFWYRAFINPSATYACVNSGEAFTSGMISDRSICIDGDIHEVLCDLYR